MWRVSDVFDTSIIIENEEKLETFETVIYLMIKVFGISIYNNISL